jgi:hypothetical protein
MPAYPASAAGFIRHHAKRSGSAAVRSGQGASLPSIRLAAAIRRYVVLGLDALLRRARRLAVEQHGRAAAGLQHDLAPRRVDAPDEVNHVARHAAVQLDDGVVVEVLVADVDVVGEHLRQYDHFLSVSVRSPVW